ncbi:MAG: alpha-2-macroglobulin, partial [Planctomycetota bacterium]
MKRLALVIGSVATLAMLIALLQGGETPRGAGAASPAGSPRAHREKAQAAKKNGNFKDAYDHFHGLALNAEEDPAFVGEDLDRATDCLQRLNRMDELDAFREGAIQAHPDNRRLLQAAALNYQTREHYGFLVAGEFRRGQNRGGGTHANAVERDRVRSLQLMARALRIAEQKDPARERAELALNFAGMLLQSRSGRAAWQLQSLTDLSTLPDYEEGYPSYGGEASGAPVDADGNPVFYKVPESFESAQSDGERWRRLLAEALEGDAVVANSAKYQLAQFLHRQFGVQTMAGYFAVQPEESALEEAEETTGPYAVETLSENETIARLATGIKRFSLPDGQNYIRLFREVADHPGGGMQDSALLSLAQIFENRRQYDKAVVFWGQYAERGPRRNADRAQKAIRQISGNWGEFEPVMTRPAGQGAAVDFRFRNGSQVALEAYRVKLPELLKDTLAYLRARPQQLEWERIDLSDIGRRLVYNNATRYLGEKVAEWTLPLEPRAGHLDRRITIATPLQRAGVYLLVAKMEQGNTSRIILWVNDTVIVQKPLDKRAYYFVADAVTGAPLAGVPVDFFGYRQDWVPQPRLYKMDVQEFRAETDAQGQVLPAPDRLKPGYTWLA